MAIPMEAGTCTKPDRSHPIHGLMKRLRRAASNGSKLHLDADHVQLLLSDDVYRLLSNLEATEMRKACATASVNDNSWGIIGSGSDRTTVAGASAGLSSGPMEDLSRGARLQLAEAMSELRRPKKPSTH